MTSEPRIRFGMFVEGEPLIEDADIGAFVGGGLVAAIAITVSWWLVAPAAAAFFTILYFKD